MANVGIVSANHSLVDHRLHDKSTVVIGKYCWIGMNAVILPGVQLGDHTVVGAGAVVTSSFTEGYCLVAGNPAKKVRTFNPDDFSEFENEFKYYGYIAAGRFPEYRSRRLNKEI